MTGKSQLLKIKLKGGSPWGFRLQGGKGTGLPLIVAKVRRKSKAHNNLKEGDVIKTVNGAPCDNVTYEQVMVIAERCGNEINIDVERTGSRSDNAVPEIKTTPTSTTEDITRKTTLTEKQLDINNHLEQNAVIENEKILEIKKNITEPNSGIKTSENMQKITNKSLDSKKFDNSSKADENSHIIKYSISPDVVSDSTVRISKEITEAGEKNEKIATETFHEKSANKEISFVKTDYEEKIKTSFPSIDLNVTTKNSHLEEKVDSAPPETSMKNITSETFESFKSEKTEVTTTKSIEMLEESHFNDKSNLSFNINNTDSAARNLPSLDTDIMSTLQLDDYNLSSNGNSEFVSTTRKKKMFSSSSFYEEPKAIYPTVEEQFEMAKKIAESLAADTNKKSKGANMFIKRAMRAPKWVHEGPDPNCEYMETSEICETNWSSSDKKEKKFPALKLVLDPRHPIDLEELRSTGQNISEHNAISPDVCHHLIRDLQSPSGKGSAMFAKRKKKSSEWIVDEEKVKSMMKAQEQELNQIKQSMNAKPGLYGSPWDSYLKSASTITGIIPKGVNPDKLAETVIKAADVKRRDSIQSLQDEPLVDTCRSPIIPATPAASYYDIYRARAPKGWSGTGNNTPTIDGICSSPVYQNTGYAEQYNTSTLPHYSYSFPKKYHFQNFNTVPRKWTTKR